MIKAAERALASGVGAACPGLQQYIHEMQTKGELVLVEGMIEVKIIIL